MFTNFAYTSSYALGMMNTKWFDPESETLVYAVLDFATKMLYVSVRLERVLFLSREKSPFAEP